MAVELKVNVINQLKLKNTAWKKGILYLTKNICP